MNTHCRVATLLLNLTYHCIFSSLLFMRLSLLYNMMIFKYSSAWVFPLHFYSALRGWRLLVRIKTLPEGHGVEEAEAEAVRWFFGQVGPKYFGQSLGLRPILPDFLHRKWGRLPLQLEAGRCRDGRGEAGHRRRALDGESEVVEEGQENRESLLILALNFVPARK